MRPNEKTFLPGAYFDSLKLPSGKKIGDTPDHELRTELHRLGVTGAHSDGKNVICALYHQMLERVWDDAGRAAVDAWLEQHKD